MQQGGEHEQVLETEQEWSRLSGHGLSHDLHHHRAEKTVTELRSPDQGEVLTISGHHHGETLLLSGHAFAERERERERTGSEKSFFSN